MAEQTMVERGRDAVYDQCRSCGLEATEREALLIFRTAIEAMREPTEEMLEILRKQGGIEGYQAMIDAALKE